MKQVKQSGGGHQEFESLVRLRRPLIATRWLSRSIPWTAFLSFLCMVAPSPGAVNLVWDPPSQFAPLNAVVDVRLYAVLDGTGLNPEIGVIEVILNWDPSKLELVGKVDNVLPEYVWFASIFPDDHLQDGLNAPYIPGGTPANDGNAWYNALSQLGAGNEAVATTDGLLVTTFRFRTLALGTAEVSMPATAGVRTRTRVIDGVIPGHITTGVLGPPASIVVSPAPDPPLSDPGGIKTRFISFSPDNAGRETALSVTLTSLHHPNPPYTGGTVADFTAFEGQVRWVGPPQQYLESISSGVLFWGAVLQCDPYYQDWGAISLLHVTGPEIVPSSLYDVQAVGISCQGAEAGCTDASSAVEIGTTRWGDLEAPWSPPSTTMQPDATDISALVNKFKSALGAPIKARALLYGQVPDMVPDVSFTHISACVDAFKGLPYPYPGPVACQ